MSGPIVLNARVTVRERITGVERVAREIIGRLAAADPELYRVVAPAPGRARGTGQAWEQLVLPVIAARQRAALVYSPANLAPIAWPSNVVVLHDAAVWRAPDSFSASYRWWHRFAERTAARRARCVVTVSEFSRAELIDVLGLAPESVVVIPNGVSDRFRPDADPEPVRSRYRLERPYVLTVGTGQARKNLPLLESVAARLAGDAVEVVWAGGSAPAAGVRALGYVDDDELPGLYTGASAFVMPSSYEGFGICCVEAMASGTPVVAADRGALRETCGGAALLVDPGDEDAFAAAVVDAFSDAALRERLRADGLRRAAELSWQRAADATDRLLRCLVGRDGEPTPS
jgi:glycosyltransferase involved in cell wall biosynthesis